MSIRSFSIFQAGNYVRDDVVSCTIQLVSDSVDQQGYVAAQLWRALEQDTSDRQPLTQVATWCIGEYGDALLYGDVSVGDDPSDIVRVSRCHTCLCNHGGSKSKSQSAIEK